MDWLKGKLGQVIAVAALVSTIAGFGYAGAGYVARLEAVEKKSGVSYASQLKALDNMDNSLTQDIIICLLYTSPSPRDTLLSRMPSSA